MGWFSSSPSRCVADRRCVRVCVCVLIFTYRTKWGKNDDPFWFPFWSILKTSFMDFWWQQKPTLAIAHMSGFTYIWLAFTVNIGKYSWSIWVVKHSHPGFFSENVTSLGDDGIFRWPEFSKVGGSWWPKQRFLGSIYLGHDLQVIHHDLKGTYQAEWTILSNSPRERSFCSF